MIAACVDEKGSEWGQQGRLPAYPQFPFPPWNWHFGSGISDLDLAIWEGLLTTAARR
jgi:hypothetical protein